MLNGRKVAAVLIFKVLKGVDLTYLTFIHRMRIQQASANLQQVIEKLLNRSSKIEFLSWSCIDYGCDFINIPVLEMSYRR